MPDPGLVTVEADLRFSVRASSGETTTGRVSGSGRDVQVRVERPDVLFAVADRADVGTLADLLAQQGLTVSVFGPQGRVATIGAGRSSRIGALATGSRRVHLRSASTVMLLPPAARRGLAAAGVAALVLVVRALLRR